MRKGGKLIYGVKIWRQKLRNVSSPKVTSATVMVSMIEEVPVCKVTIEDINKALRPRSSLTIEEARKILSE